MKQKQFLLFIALLLAATFPLFNIVAGDTLDTLVTINNLDPFILRDSMEIFINVGDADLTLLENATVEIKCNATVNDPNGGGDISVVNATLYDHINSNSQSGDDNNDHYTNSSCSIGDVSGSIVGVECIFVVQYYANNQTWSCNMTAIDTADNQNSTYANKTMNSLLALNVPATINYGTLNPGDTSAVNNSNVTNTGNRNLNIKIYGYANNATNSPNAMNCTGGVDKNISLYFMRYNVTAAACNFLSWLGNYTNLTNISNEITWTQFDIAQRTIDTAGAQTRNYTCWVLKIPTAGESDISGTCKGIVSFTALLA